MKICFSFFPFFLLKHGFDYCHDILINKGNNKNWFFDFANHKLKGTYCISSNSGGIISANKAACWKRLSIMFYEWLFLRNKPLLNNSNRQ